MGALDVIKSWMGIGPWTSRPGPLTGPAAYTEDGWIPMNWPLNFGQVGWDPIPGGTNSVVYSCIMLYARTIAQLPGSHRKSLDNGGTETITTSALSRVLKGPNDYQTRSDFLQNMVVALLEEGNAYALAIRNNRFEVDQLHQFGSRQTRAYVSQDSGEIFYSVGGNPVMDYRNDPAFAAGTRWIVPARDVLHIKGPAPKDPLHGESPLVAGGLPIWMNSGGASYFMRFFQNMSRPSGVIETDNVLTGQQATELRARWEDHTKGVNIGGTPILTMGMKWKPMGMTSQDAQIAEAMKLSVADIARLFGVPLALIDSMEGSTYSNVEQLIMVWLRQGLGFYIDNIELAFDKLFAIERTTEYTEFNVDALLRPDFKSRVDGLARAVQGGIYAPNEARKIEGLAAAKDGDEPRVQMQVVPLSVNAEKPEPPKPAPAPVAPPSDGAGDAPPVPEPQKLYSERALKAFLHLARTGTDG